MAGPRRERKLQLLEEKMKSIRGFQGEGSAVGSSRSKVANGGGSRLLSEHDELVGRKNEQSESELRSHVITTDQSDSESDQEDEEGKLITIALKLPNQSVKKQFKTSYKIKVREVEPFSVP